VKIVTDILEPEEIEAAEDNNVDLSRYTGSGRNIIMFYEFTNDQFKTLCQSPEYRDCLFVYPARVRGMRFDDLSEYPNSLGVYIEHGAISHWNDLEDTRDQEDTPKILIDRCIDIIRQSTLKRLAFAVHDRDQEPWLFGRPRDASLEVRQYITDQLLALGRVVEHRRATAL
jgi:hypothetical protein